MLILKVLWRILLVILTTAIWVIVSCGGTGILYWLIFRPTGQYNFDALEAAMWGSIIIWPITFVWAIWKREYIVLLAEKIWNSYRIIKVILITILWGAILSLINYWISDYLDWRYMDIIDQLNIIEIGILFCFSVWFTFFRKITTTSKEITEKSNI